MPQEQCVLMCFSCQTFQAHIVKKSKKWDCKVCGMKQSLKRKYGQGTGKECREHVQKLNKMRMDKSEDLDSFVSEDVNDFEKEDIPYTVNAVKSNNVSKWEAFVDPEEENDEEREDHFSIANVQKKRKLCQKQIFNGNQQKKVWEKTKNDVDSQEFTVNRNEDHKRNENIEQPLQKLQSTEKETTPNIKYGKYSKYLGVEDENDHFQDESDSSLEEISFGKEKNHGLGQIERTASQKRFKCGQMPSEDDLDDILNF